MKQKFPNVSGTLWDGEFHVSFDCVGEETCRYKMCYEMPWNGEDECNYRDHGSCFCPVAHQVALAALQARIKKELKKIEEAYE